MIRIVLAVPERLSAEDHARLQDAGLTVLAEAGSARALARLLATADAAVPQVVLLHDALDRLDRFPDLPERIALRWGAATALLVPNPQPAAGLGNGEAAPRSTVAPAVLTRARHAGYAGVTLWPGDPDDLYDAALAALSALPPPHTAAVAPLGPDGAPAPPKAPAVLVGVRGEKGGTGKTMVVENLCALAAQAGLNVLLLDMDQNASAFLPVLRATGTPSAGKGILAYFAAYGKWRANAGADPQGCVQTAAQLLALATVRYPAHPGLPAFDLLPGVRGADQGDLLDEDEHLEALDMLAQAARAIYDLVVVDLGQSHVRAMHQCWAAEADKLLVVTEPTFRSVVGAAEGQIKLMNVIGKKSDQCLIVVNRVRDNPYQMASADLRSQFSRRLGVDGTVGPDAPDNPPSRPPQLEIVGILRDAPDLVDKGNYYKVPWVLLDSAEHHKLMDDFHAMATSLLGAGVLPERRPAAVALARARAAVRRLFHSRADASGRDGLALPAPAVSTDDASTPMVPFLEHQEGIDGREAAEAAECGSAVPGPGGPHTATSPIAPSSPASPAALAARLPTSSSEGNEAARPAVDGPRAERSLSRARRQRLTRRRLCADANGHDEAPPSLLTTGQAADGAP
jgi:MinD-like ATPase involved in chromosome partitioning or flagellar assembly